MLRSRTTLHAPALPVKTDRSSQMDSFGRRQTAWGVVGHDIGGRRLEIAFEVAGEAFARHTLREDDGLAVVMVVAVVVVVAVGVARVMLDVVT